MTTALRREPVHALRRRAAADRVAATNAVAGQFFGERADDIARACCAMAERFQRGGRMFVSGDGAQRSDVAHVVVEFVHPIVVGKRALPAMPLPPSDSGAALSAMSTMMRPADMLMVLAAGAPGEAQRAILASARAEGMLTMALTGSSSRSVVDAEFLFAVPAADACIVQETHEILYHVLWELVHVFIDHRPVTA